MSGRSFPDELIRTRGEGVLDRELGFLKTHLG